MIETCWDRLSQAGGGASVTAIGLVRGHIALDWDNTPMEMIRSALDKAAQLAPLDDRIWLGKANLALRVSSFDEAGRWLEACVQQRPDDVPVWRARLNWAKATGRVAEAQEALAHLPAEEREPAQVQGLAACLAGAAAIPSRNGVVENLIAADPADFIALDRLAELAVQNGQPARAAELRRQKTELDRVRARYQKLYQRSQPTRDSAEMARLAEQLGHWFEAQRS